MLDQNNYSAQKARHDFEEEESSFLKELSVFDPETETIFTIKIQGSRVLEFKPGGNNHGKK